MRDTRRTIDLSRGYLPERALDNRTENFLQYLHPRTFRYTVFASSREFRLKKKKKKKIFLFATYERDRKNGGRGRRLLRGSIDHHRLARKSRRGSIVGDIRGFFLATVTLLRLVATLEDAPRRTTARLRERDSTQQHRRSCRAILQKLRWFTLRKAAAYHSLGE